MVNNLKSDLLEIWMNGFKVGFLEKQSEHQCSFWYAPDWLAYSGARPISLSLPLIQKKFDDRKTKGFFENLLPDNPLLRTQIQRYFGLPTPHYFDLLKKIGRDCVGAIQLLSPGENGTFSQMLSESLDDHQMASILKTLHQHPLGMNHQQQEFRISVSGAQEKTAFLYWNNQWHKPLSGTPTTHIFKLPMRSLENYQIDLSDSCENEWLCLKILEAFGLPVASTDICFFQDVKVLVVQRFDRQLSSDQKKILRLPQEDFCQVMSIPSDLKYQSEGGPGIKDIMGILQNSKNSILDQHLFFRSQIIFWLLAAIDGHAKNFSLFIEPGGQYRLTPFYDVISAYPMIRRRSLDAKKIKMAMALEGTNRHYHWDHVQRRYFISTAERCRYPVHLAEQMLEEVLAQVDGVIDKVSQQLPSHFSHAVSEPIFEGLRQTRDNLRS